MRTSQQIRTLAQAMIKQARLLKSDGADDLAKSLVRRALALREDALMRPAREPALIPIPVRRR